jgi:hypothetical protein
MNEHIRDMWWNEDEVTVKAWFVLLCDARTFIPQISERREQGHSTKLLSVRNNMRLDALNQGYIADPSSHPGPFPYPTNVTTKQPQESYPSNS